MAPDGADVDQFEPLPSTLARRRSNARISITGLLGSMRWDRIEGDGAAILEAECACGCCLELIRGSACIHGIFYTLVELEDLEKGS